MDESIDWVNKNREKRKQPFLENILYLVDLPHCNSNVHFPNWNHNWCFPRLGFKVKEERTIWFKKITNRIHTQMKKYKP